MQLLCCFGYLGLIWLLGWAGLAAVLGRRPRQGMELAALAWAGGYGLLGLILFGCSLCGCVPSRAMLVGIAAGAVVAAIALMRRWPGRWVGGSAKAVVPWPYLILGWLAVALLAAAAVNVVVQSLGVHGLADIDAFGDWMFRAKIVAALPLRPVPGPLLDPTLSYSHQDYPLGVPLVAAGMYAAVGAQAVWAIKVLILPIYFSLMAVLYAALRKHLNWIGAAAVTAAFVASPVVMDNAPLTVGEMPLVLMHACCLVLLLEWMLEGGRGVLVAAAAFAAFGGFIKNEGTALVPLVGAVAMVAALLRTGERRKRLVDVVTAGAVAMALLGPWLVYRRLLPHTHEDYGEKLSSIATVIGHVPRLAAVLPAYLGHLLEPNEAGLLWIVLAVAAIAGWRAWRRPAVVLLWGLLVLHLGMYAIIFMVTPWKLDVLIPMVGAKLIMHAAPAAALLVGLHLEGMARWRGFGGNSSAEAEQPRVSI